MYVNEIVKLLWNRVKHPRKIRTVNRCLRGHWVLRQLQITALNSWAT